jgi:hypothetical protein
LNQHRTFGPAWGAAAALLLLLAGPVQAGPAGGAAGDAREPASPAALTQAAWAVTNGDTHGRPFIVVDKLAARVFAFDGDGNLLSGTPALLGIARGDESPPGIGTMALADIRLELRITPAGRYEAHLGLNAAGHNILWVDYDAALSLHAVVTGNAKERRLQRLATASILDNRISYGCINVPKQFFEGVIEPLFTPANGLVYILPEDTSISAPLGSKP